MRSAGRASDDGTTRAFWNRRGGSPRHTLERKKHHPVVMLVLRQQSKKNGRADCSREWPPDYRALCTRRESPVSRRLVVELDSGVLRHGINRAGLGSSQLRRVHQPLASTSRT
jgi:hypothetical protein